MKVGIAFDLKTDFSPGPLSLAGGGAGQPEDLFEEYDSEETVEAIAKAIRAAGHETVMLGGGRRFLELLLRAPPDIVFNIAEGRGSRSREAHVPAACEMLSVPYTHSDPLTLAVTLDKHVAKRLVASYGLSTPAFVLLERAEDLGSAELPPFPLIAKLAFEGSSMGIRRHSRADDRDALEAKIRWLFAEYRQPVLVEQFLTGPEVTAGILGNEQPHVLGLMEIAPRRGSCEDFIYSLEVKRNYLEEVDYHVPPRLPQATLRALERLALGAYRALGCRDVARVDMRLGPDQRPYFLEVNPLPGLNPVTGDLPIMAARAGWTYDRLIREILAAALARLAAQAAEPTRT